MLFQAAVFRYFFRYVPELKMTDVTCSSSGFPKPVLPAAWQPARYPEVILVLIMHFLFYLKTVNQEKLLWWLIQSLNFYVKKKQQKKHDWSYWNFTGEISIWISTFLFCTTCIFPCFMWHCVALCVLQTLCKDQSMSPGVHSFGQYEWRQQLALSFPQRHPGGAGHQQHQVPQCDYNVRLLWAIKLVQNPQ